MSRQRRVQHLAPAASGERQQPDRGDGLGPLRSSLASRVRPSRANSSVSRKRATSFLGFFAMPRQGLAVALAQAPLLGPEHHGAQYLEGAIGRAGLVPARRVEPRGRVLGADVVDRQLAKRRAGCGT